MATKERKDEWERESTLGLSDLSYLKPLNGRLSWCVTSWLTLALCACSRLWSDTRRLALEKPPFFLQLELFPARQSSELPSCHAEHRHIVFLREVILRENKTFSEREGRAGISASR